MRSGESVARDEQLTVNEDVDFDHRLRAAGWTIGYEPAMTVVLGRPGADR